MTKVSVIVPFHNVENYISKCLSSLIYQTLEDIEIICINDASTDLSKEKVQSYANNDKRIIILNTNELSGQSYCRNLGLEIASGEYIGFADSDDWVELDMFEKMYNSAKRFDTDITMCGASLYDDKEQKLYTDDYYSLKPLEKFQNKCFNACDTKDEILNINVVLWNKIYKREFLNAVNAKFASGYIYEDLLFFFETYLKAEKINIVPENLYYYRTNRSCSTMQNSDKKVYDRIPMVERTYNALKQASFFEEKKIDIICWIIDDIFHRYTVLEDKYYEDYYNAMKGFFSRIELSSEDMEKLKVSYCHDEFKNILERSYFGFWSFLIEKYKTSNKRIKAAEHKCNLDILAIKDYLNRYKRETNEEKDEIIKWWENHCNEEKENLSAALNKQFEEEKELLQKTLSDEKKSALEEQFEYLNDIKQKDMKEMYEKQQHDFQKRNIEALEQQKENLTAAFNKRLEEEKEAALKEQFEYLSDIKQKDMKEMYEKQQCDFQKRNTEALEEQKEHLTLYYEYKLKEQNEIHTKTLCRIKDYYENEFFLVKIILKSYRLKNQFINKIKKVLKKN